MLTLIVIVTELWSSAIFYYLQNLSSACLESLYLGNTDASDAMVTAVLDKVFSHLCIIKADLHGVIFRM